MAVGVIVFANKSKGLGNVESPKHMDVASRNQRLRETLESMGLFVLPVFCEDDPSRIDYMQVSVATPEHIRKSSSGTAVAHPVPRPQVADVVTPSEGNGNNVVNFPPVV